MIEHGYVILTMSLNGTVLTDTGDEVLINRYDSKEISFDTEGNPKWVDPTPGKREEIPEIGTRVVLYRHPMTSKAFAWALESRYDEVKALVLVEDEEMVSSTLVSPISRNTWSEAMISQELARRFSAFFKITEGRSITELQESQLAGDKLILLKAQNALWSGLPLDMAIIHSTLDHMCQAFQETDVLRQSPGWTPYCGVDAQDSE